MSTQTQTPAPAATPAAPRKIDWGAVLMEGRALIGLIVIMAVFTVLSPNFLQPDNLLLMTRHVAMNALLALGYNEKEAASAMKQLPADVSTSDGIRQALKLLSKV